MTAPQPPSSLHPKPPLLSLPLPTPSTPPLLLTIRFSASLPDLELDIPRPSSTTVVSLKHLIRARLGEPNAQRRLRFIHGGKILPDSAVLSSVLRAPPPPPPSSSAIPSPSLHKPRHEEKTRDDDDDNSHINKGKSIPGRPAPPQRIYVNCSIGDALTPAELQAEASAAAASTASATSTTTQQMPSPATGTTPTPTTTTTTTTTTTPTPRGFDRLLSAGFTAAEVNALRLQFRSAHASRYTPDALPSPDGFRRMEDAWIDDNGGSASMPSALGGSTNSSSNGGTGAGGTDSDDVGLVAMVDVMVRGVVTGFVWPLGSAGWLVREEGMASGRWRFMVGVGVVFSMLIGIIRTISGEK
ncbi:DUF2407 C-terminal domain-containing protein [Xylariaceae sp. FL0662B]|nr:DUF2407 C-terminal domain-containing protein [Xylariaceae sp. FL0662B]